MCERSETLDSMAPMEAMTPVEAWRDALDKALRISRMTFPVDDEDSFAVTVSFKRTGSTLDCDKPSTAQIVWESTQTATSTTIPPISPSTKSTKLAIAKAKLLARMPTRRSVVERLLGGSRRHAKVVPA